ncbi:MAG: CHASE2 domain-containing protein [Okeania sp. SIO3B5]|uniref:CHASE2 domain-containing protein n=1 Tax=Okeania sp. SIO3B5 TaxID=2607811 RepID=UPI0014006FD2|nr:CHASE2 domain-containing protein [Okeania sp. SIO3B5]NEO55943.1 CHASE2 domain-containing protein [Okeania sp. SIO3B5]
MSREAVFQLSIIHYPLSINNMIYRSTGGSLSVDDPTYVERKQDTELLEKLLEGEYCYVFNSRQMGKSSLRVRIIDKLSSQGCQCISIDMSMLSDFSIPKESWYDGFLTELFDKCDLENSNNFQEWIATHRNSSNLQRWKLFLEEILFRNFPNQKIYIFLDEIDTLGKCYFKDEFLGFIRSCYNRRAENKNSDYHRLIFGFFGAVTPGDLIKNRRHTPFNVGYGIELTELTFADAKEHLTQGLEGYVEKPDVVLRKVFDWTGGQPFLTQKLCQIVVDDRDSPRPNIGKLVQEHILTSWEDKDNPIHLKYIRDYLLNDVELLRLYQTILKRGKVKFNNSQVQMSLKLSGIVLKKQDKLIVFNKIYQRIFNKNWVKEQLVNLENNLDLPKPKRWSMTFAIAGLLSVGVIGIRALGWLQPLELNQFDLLMRSRLPEKPDSNILIVEATQADINKFGIGNVLKDEILAEVITKIDAFQPAIIGLDLWREKPLESEANYRRLLNILANNQKIIAVCSTSEYRPNKPGTIPPEGVPKERLGFTDLALDNGQFKIVRRHLMFMGTEEKDPCQTGYSLSARVALDFLAIKGIKPENTPEGNVIIGGVILKRLRKGEGIYQNFDDGGFQILLNYRNSKQVAKTITISDVLNGEINDYLVKDKIVLIGITDPAAGDKFSTPYSQVQLPNQKQMSGVILHAHQVSQIISAVLDGRPLITFWSWQVEWLWILALSILICVVSRHFLRGFYLLLFTVENIIVLYFVSLFVLNLGIVVPLVPSILVLIVNVAISVISYQLNSLPFPRKGEGD